MSTQTIIVEGINDDFTILKDEDEEITFYHREDTNIRLDKNQVKLLIRVLQSMVEE